MGQTLTEIAKTLKNTNKRVQLIYAFNGTGKTRLSREFKELISPKTADAESQEELKPKILYYNAFTEDLFYWNNKELKLKIQPNNFTDWVFYDQGQELNIISNFQHYTDDKLTPQFDKSFSEVRFSFQRGDDSDSDFLKISKGEESCFIWSVFYSLLQEVIDVLIPLGEAQEELNSLEKVANDNNAKARKAEKQAKNTQKEEDIKLAQIAQREVIATNVAISEAEDRLDSFNGLFDSLEYVFIDDPVSSLDDNHLVELAVDIAELIKSSNTQLKFVITTHNPLFYNVLFNEFNSKDFRFKFKEEHAIKRRLEKLEDGTYLLHNSNDSPFSYHLCLLSELERVIVSGEIHKYHFNFLRNILEKTSTFLGYTRWEELLPEETEGTRTAYYKRIINLSSHAKHSGEEASIIEANDKAVLVFLVKKIREMYRFKNNNTNDNKESI